MSFQRHKSKACALVLFTAISFTQLFKHFYHLPALLKETEHFSAVTHDCVCVNLYTVLIMKTLTFSPLVTSQSVGLYSRL